MAQCKKLTAWLLTLAMLFTMLPGLTVTAWAAETDDPRCYCAEACTEDNLNIWCDICGALGASACLGEGEAAAYAVDLPLWIAGVQVTTVNADDITAAINAVGFAAEGDASYDYDTNTLTLDGFVCAGMGTDYSDDGKILSMLYYADPDQTLNLRLKGVNSITMVYGGEAATSYSYYGVLIGNPNERVDSNLNVTEDSTGSLGVEFYGGNLLDGNVSAAGIYVNGDFTLPSGSITATSMAPSGNGVFATGSIEVSGGRLDATGGNYGIFDFGQYMEISGGVVTAKGGKGAFSHAPDIAETFTAGVWYGEDESATGKISASEADATVYTGNKYVRIADASSTVESYPLWIGGEQLTSDNLTLTSVGSAAYDPDSNTLTLNTYQYQGEGYTDADGISAAIYYGGTGTLNLVVTGMSWINNGSRTSSRPYGIYTAGALELSGSGMLDVSGSAGKSESAGIYTDGNFTVTGGTVTVGFDSADNEPYKTYGVYVNGDLTVEDGTLNASGGVANYSYGVYATGDIMLNGGTLTGTGGSDDGTSLTKYSYGVWLEGGITVTAGEMSGIGGDVLNQSYGVYTYGSDVVAVTGGKLRATGGNTNNVSYGVFGNVNVSGGILVANGGDVSGNSSYGVYASSSRSVTVSGGIFSATGGSAQGTSGMSCGVSSSSVEFSGGTVTATGGNATSMSWGVYSEASTVSGSDTTVTVSGATNAFIFAPTVTLDGAAVWYGADESTATKTPASDIDTAYRSKYIRIAKDEGDAPGTLYPVWAGGVQFTSGKTTISGGAGSAALTVEGEGAYTLTLDNYTYNGVGYNDAAIYFDGDAALNLVLNGTNEVTHISLTGEDSYGVLVNGDLIVSGEGSLEAVTDSTAWNNNTGVKVSGTLQADSGSLTGIGGDVDSLSGNGNGIYAGDIVINNGEVTATGRMHGVSAGTITVGGGKLTATGSYEDGVNALGSVTVKGGTVIATGVKDGIHSGTNITISGGTVTATGVGAQYTSESKGVNAGTVTVSGGTLTATGVNYGIGGGTNGVSISGGEVIASGGQGAFEVEEDEPVPVVDTGAFTDAAVWYGADEAEALENGQKGIGVLAGNYNKKYVRIAQGSSDDVTLYPVWVGGKQFRSDYLTIPGDKGTAELTVNTTDSANPVYTLTLTDYEYIGAGHEGAVIYSEVPLTIELNGDNRVISYGSTLYGVYFEDDLTVTGDGDDTLTAIGSTAAFNKIPNIDHALAVYDEQENYVGNSDWAALKYARIAERIKVDYTVETYTMDTNGDYGTPETETLTAAVDSAVSVAPEAKIGFTVDTAKSILSGTVAADGSTVLKVYYSRDQYNIHYTTNGGTINGTYPTTYTYGVGAELPDDVTLEGYTFKGWYSQPTGDTDNIGSIGTGAAGDKYYYAYWEINEYTITFDTDGGSEVAPITLDYNTPVTAPADPTKTGYTFTGWSPEIPAAMPAEDITVTAQWTVNQYPVTFNAGEGTFATGSKEITINVDFGTVPTAPETPTLTGYAFAGWEPALAPVTVNGAAYTATYAPGSVNYTVEIYTMDTTGAYGDPVIETKTAETADFVFAKTEAKEGFTVDTDTSVLEGVVAADGSTVLKVFYRRIQYDLKTVVDSVENVETYYYGETITPPASPEKTGYTFAGWEPELPETMPANDVTVTAQWTVIQYTITFDPDNGEEPTTITQNYGTAITAPTTPTKDGCHFLRWDTEVPATMPRENLTITAVWEAHTPGYTASGDTITEACTGCPIVVTGKATISAAGKTYDGTAVTASVAYSTNWMGGDLAITYAVKDGETLPEAPKNAGTYTASITIGGATASVEFTIEQKELTPAISGSVSKPYDGTTTVPDGLSITLNGKMGNDDVTAAASYAYAGVNVGTTKINATGITLIGETAKNYTLSSATASADVGKIIKAAVPTVNIPVQQHIHTIATTDNTVNIAEKLPDDRGETSYTVSAAGDFFKDGMTVSEDGVLTYGTNKAEGEAAGTITVAVTMANYESVNVVVQVELTEKTVAEITLPDAQDGVYNGQAQIGYTGQPDVTGYEGTLEVIYTGRNGTEYDSEDAPVDAGDYTVIFSVPADDPYYTGSASLEFTVAKVVLTITADNKTVYRNTALPELTYTAEGLVGDDVLNPEPTIRCDADPSVIGSYPITVSGADAGANYSISYQNGTLTVYETTYTVTFVWNGAQGGEAAQTVAKDAKVAAPEIPVYDGYRFMGWFADEALTEEWDMDSDTVTGDISLYAKWLKKADFSVGETGIQDIVVDDTAAIIQPTEEEIDLIVENSKDDETIVIDLFGLDDTVNEVQIPQKLISEIVDSMDDPETETEHLEIITPAGAISLDRDALEALIEHEEEDTDCDLVLGFAEPESDELTPAQQDALKELNVCGIYDVYAECTVNGSVRLTETGAAEIRVPFTIPDGCSADEFTVWCVSEDGELEKLTAWYEDGCMIWSADDFSDFVIVYEEKADDDSEKEDFFQDQWMMSLMLLFNQKFDIKAIAAEGGTITPAGNSKVKYDKNITYTITPDEGYEISAVLVDGKDIGAVSEYTFQRVKKNHTITAVFEEIQWQNPFMDVDEADWFYEDVQFVSETGLMIGTNTAGTQFSPDAALTRAMLVTVLWRLEGEPVVNYLMPFTDVPADEWYTEAVRWAAAEGIVKGYEDSTFRPGTEITREQVMAILHRYAAYKGLESGMIFPMIPQYNYSLWAENDILWADMVGLTSGIGADIYDMTTYASRAEIAAYLRRFCEAFMEE